MGERRRVVDDRGLYIPEPDKEARGFTWDQKRLSPKQRRDRDEANRRRGRIERRMKNAGDRMFCPACSFQLWGEVDGLPKLRKDGKGFLVGWRCVRCGFDRRDDSPAIPWHESIEAHIKFLHKLQETEPYVKIPDWASETVEAMDPPSSNTCSEDGCEVDVRDWNREVWDDGSIVYRGRDLKGRVALRHKHPGAGVMKKAADSRWSKSDQKKRAAEKRKREFGDQTED